MSDLTPMDIAMEYTDKAAELVGRIGPAIEASALRAFADANRFPADWIMFRRDDGTSVTVTDLLRKTAARKLGYRGQASRDSVHFDETRAEVERLRARFDEVVAEKNQAIEDWGKAIEERDAARAELERVKGEHWNAFGIRHLAAERAKIDALARIAYDDMWGERFPHRHEDTSGGPDCAGCWADMILQAIGEEPKDPKTTALFDVPAARQAERDTGVDLGDLAVMLDEVLRHVTALPSNMYYRTRLPRAEAPTEAANPAGNRSASKYTGNQAAPERDLADHLRAGGFGTLASTVDRIDSSNKKWRKALNTAATHLQEQGRKLGAPSPTVRDVMAAAYRNGLGLRKDVDDHETRSCSDEPGRREHWHLREWAITNPHGRQIGRLEVEEGPQGTQARLTSRRDPESEKRLYTDPTPGDLLDAARVAGLITK